MNKQIAEYDIIPTEQRAMKKGVWGTMDCLMADEVITKWGKLRHKRITTAWIDYQKAFDSIPHELIPWMLRALGLNSHIVDMITALMPKWQTQFSIRTSGGTVTTEPVTLLRGVFQGDTLSVLLFCLAMCMISYALKTEHENLGIPLLSEVLSNHLFYVDDLKMFALSAKKLDRMILTVQRVSTSIGRH